MVKQSWIIASMSSNNRIFLDILRSLSLLGKSGAIQIRILNIYINVINDHSPPPPPPPPPFIFFFVSDYLSVFYQCFISVWEFSNLLWLNFGMSALSERSFITCQNFQFWQVCSFDGLSVCLSVCLFVCNIHDTGRTVQAINTKLGTYMYLGSGYGCIVFGVYDVIDDVIRSKNRSNFKIAITPSIFELELRSKAQNVGYWTGYLGDIPNFRWHLWRKSSPDLKFSSVLKIS